MFWPPQEISKLISRKLVAKSIVHSVYHKNIAMGCGIYYNRCDECYRSVYYTSLQVNIMTFCVKVKFFFCYDRLW